MDTTSKRATSDGNRFLDELYDATTKNGGTALGFRIFDVQLSGSLTEEWLRGALQGEGITPEEADWMIGEALLRKRTNSAGDCGYILYTPYQAEVLKKLKGTGRYDQEELHHTMNDWDDYLEAIVMEEPSYDDESIPDYQHFVRRAREMRELFEEDEGRPRPDIIAPEQWLVQQADAQKKLKMWRKVCGIVESTAEEDLSSNFRSSVHRQLFHLRWWDEFVRVNMAKRFETAITQGYSTDVTFSGWSSQGDEFTLENINWASSIRMYQQTRREGKTFPLRTPDFNVTARGLEFLTTPSPDRYAELYSSYRLNDLTAALAEVGPDLWSIQQPSTGDSLCPECTKPFERTSPKRVYCSERCQKRAKSRRWRQSDPERARSAQARYWKTAYPDPD